MRLVEFFNVTRLDELSQSNLKLYREFVKSLVPGNIFMPESSRWSIWGKKAIVSPTFPEFMQAKYPNVELFAYESVPQEIRAEYESMILDDYRAALGKMRQLDIGPSGVWMSNPRLISKPTWLIHFTNFKHAASAASGEGFSVGWGNWDFMAYYEKFSQSPGFNFAFEAGSPEADKHARTAQYGSTAIMFLGTGVKVYHEGDKQDQVVFWGQDVDPRSMVLITLNRHDEKFCVRGHPMKGLHGPEPRTYRDKPGKKFYDEPEQGEGVCVFQHEDISRVADWVQKNWRQYSKVISGW